MYTQGLMMEMRKDRIVIASFFSKKFIISCRIFKNKNIFDDTVLSILQRLLIIVTLVLSTLYIHSVGTNITYTQ